MKKINPIPADRIVVGIDVASDMLEVFIDPSGERLEVPNRRKELRRLAARLKKLGTVLVVMEATGGYEQAAADALAEAEVPVAVCYPVRVRQFARAMGILAKTDRVDAALLAAYGRMAGLKGFTAVTPEVRRLRELVSRRAQLVEARLSEQNRLATAGKADRPSIDRHIAFLVKEAERIDAQLREMVGSSDELTAADLRLRSAPGVGRVLSHVLIALLPELGALSDKQISTLVGVAPFACESGSHKGRRRCKGGRNPVRRVLYMATIAATRFNPAIKAFYEQLCQRGKLKKVALIACARKLLVTLNAMTRDCLDWDARRFAQQT